MLFCTDRPDTSGDPAAARAEVGRILATDALSGEMPAADRTYVAQVIAARTGLSRADAEKRVSDVVEQARIAGRSWRRARSAGRTPIDQAACAIWRYWAMAQLSRAWPRSLAISGVSGLDPEGVEALDFSASPIERREALTSGKCPRTTH